ncbi:ABC transporter permease [Pseudoclavibacter terrae]|uniref:ABC transporter permease n=1 Tax=Pseudoclavibacter terrae TaxID=1530195 RepID=UPI00232C9328|nr:ABC transporter permease [Pseudoclavibacter terrae]
MKAHWPVRVFGVILGAVLILPTLIVVATAFTSGNRITFPPNGFSLRWFEDVLSSQLWMGSLFNSLQVAVLAAVLAAVFGISLALGAARGRGIPRGLFMALGVMPSVVPLIVLGLGVFLVLLELRGTGGIVTLAMAHAVLGVPFCFINVLAALSSLDPRIEEAARISGANNLQTVIRITLPQILPATLVGALLAFVTSWDEVVVAIFLNTPTFRTLPVVIWGEVRSEFAPSISAIATILTIVSVLAFTLAAVAGRISARRRNV